MILQVTDGDVTGDDQTVPGVDFPINLAPDTDFTGWTVTGDSPHRLLLDPAGLFRAHEVGDETVSASFTRPEIPATPTAQDVTDVLVTLHLATQAMALHQAAPKKSRSSK
jgi:hypothetical protein